jgi:hypothetical protein
MNVDFDPSNARPLYPRFQTYRCLAANYVQGHYRTFRDSYMTRRHHAAGASRSIVLWFGQRGRQLLSNIKRAGKRLVRCHAATFREERTDEFTLIGGQCAFPAGVAC